MSTAVLTKEVLNPFEIAQQQFDIAADHLKLDAGLRAILKHTQEATDCFHPRAHGRRANSGVRRLPRAV